MLLISYIIEMNAYAIPCIAESHKVKGASAHLKFKILKSMQYTVKTHSN